MLCENRVSFGGLFNPLLVACCNISFKCFKLFYILYCDFVSHLGVAKGRTAIEQINKCGRIYSLHSASTGQMDRKQFGVGGICSNTIGAK